MGDHSHQEQRPSSIVTATHAVFEPGMSAFQPAGAHQKDDSAGVYDQDETGSSTEATIVPSSDGTAGATAAFTMSYHGGMFQDFYTATFPDGIRVGAPVDWNASIQGDTGSCMTAP